MRLSEKKRLFLTDKVKLMESCLPQDKNQASNSKIPPSKSTIIFEEKVALNSQVLGAGDLFVGANSYCNDGGYIRVDQGGGIYIGRYCSIGRRVSIGAGAHSLSGVSTSPALRGVRSKPYSDDEKAKIKQNKKSNITVIESDVWIGDGVVISPGVTIGVGSVIGSNSVVTKNIEPYQIVAGSPARPVGSRLASDVAAALLSTEWWEYTEEQLNNLPLANIFEFIKHQKPKPNSLASYINTKQQQ